MSVFSKNNFIYLSIFLFPVFIATVKTGGSVFYLLLFILGVCCGWTAWKELEKWEKKVFIGFLLFFLLVILSVINTEDYNSAIKRIARYMHFPLAIPMYLLLRNFRLETGKIYLLGLMSGSLVMFIQAFYQVHILNMSRAFGAYNPLVIGDISIFAGLVFVGAFFLVANSWRQYLLLTITMGLAFYSSVLSWARGGWIALPIVLLWILWINRKRMTNIHFFLVIALIPILSWGFMNIDFVKKRIDISVNDFREYVETPDKKNSLNQRIKMWQNSIAIWKINPLLGTGVGDYKNDSLQLVSDGKASKHTVFSHAHNIYFDMLATSGLLGLLAMLIFIQIIPFRIFYLFWLREFNPWIKFYAISGMITILAFAIFGLTEGWLARNSFVRTYLMSIIVFMSSIAIVKSQSNGSTSLKHF